jgi:hypothetical protein
MIRFAVISSSELASRPDWSVEAIVRGFKSYCEMKDHDARAKRRSILIDQIKRAMKTDTLSETELKGLTAFLILLETDNDSTEDSQKA